MRPPQVLLYLVCFALKTGSAQERFSKIELNSRFLAGPRIAHIYLPPSYDKDQNRRFPVLYVHDGQNIFSPAGTNIAFGWGNWELDKTADRLSREGKMQETILVGVENSPNRYAEYCGRIRSPVTTNNTPFENYSAFLIQELKPRVDSQYRTQPHASSTGVMGSSIGGLCSLALAWEHPEVFGRAASLSGSFMVEQTNFLDRVLKPYNRKPKPVRIYLDSGTTDFTGGDDGKALTKAVADELRRIGWDKDLLHYTDAKPLNAAELETTGLRKDKWAEAQTSQHNEFYWRLRACRALTFLFPPDK